MKTLMIAASICVIPAFLLGIVIPMSMFLNSVGSGQSHLDETVFWIYMSIDAISLGVILSAVLIIQKYTPQLDKFDEHEKELNKREQELEDLIENYNNLITNQTK